MRSTNYEIVFVYSEMQVSEENEIAKKTGKVFKPGKVYSGHISKDYSNMIKPDQLEFMKSQYPDVKIVDRGMKNTFKFTPPSKEYV